MLGMLVLVTVVFVLYSNFFKTITVEDTMQNHILTATQILSRYKLSNMAETHIINSVHNTSNFELSQEKCNPHDCTTFMNTTYLSQDCRMINL